VFRKLLAIAGTIIMLALSQLAVAQTAIVVSATPSSPVAPATVTLSVSAAPGSAPVAVTQVEYFRGKTSLGIALNAPFSLTVPDMAAGTYTIIAKAKTTDASNPVVQSAPLSLTVGTPIGAASANFIHTDQLNTPRAIANGSGNLVWQWDSDPFGKDAANEQPAGQGPMAFNPRFPGQQFDQETGLHYNYFRDYDPVLGRYIQSDPIGLRGGINTYGYVRGNPLSFFDLLGLEPASTIQCDGKGGYEVIINDRGPARGCTTIHEQSHVQDWKERYGKDSCQGKERGYLPMENTADYRNFRRDSECRAYEAEKQCVKKCNDPTAQKAWDQGVERFYCNQYDSWKRK
jgi:RHS repeat-associated protein